MHDDDVLRMVARIDPARREHPAEVSPEALLASIHARIAQTPHDHRLDRSHWNRSRWFAAAVGLASLLSLPALAVSGALNPLFGFSAASTPVEPAALDKASLRALRLLHASPQSVRLVAVRGDIGFYAARSESGNLCLGIGRRTGSPLSFTQLQCGSGGQNSFPSPEVPVLQASPVFGTEGIPDVFMPHLAGFAADGVSAVEVRGPSGVLARAQVVDNIFVAVVPQAPVTWIEAYDSNGSKIWSRPLTH